MQKNATLNANSCDYFSFICRSKMRLRADGGLAGGALPQGGRGVGARGGGAGPRGRERARGKTRRPARPQGRGEDRLRRHAGDLLVKILNTKIPILLRLGSDCNFCSHLSFHLFNSFSDFISNIAFEKRVLITFC